MASTEIAEKQRFVVLDGMRGLAALAVITDHVESDLMRALLPGRPLAVDFFFVLSGFVLAHVYMQRLQSGMSLWSFMRVRLVRLYPLYLVGLALAATMALITALKGWENFTTAQVAASFLFGLLFVPCPPGFSLWPNAPFPLNGPSWSLFCELVINAVFALAARWLTPTLCVAFMVLGGGAFVFATFQGWDVGGYAWDNFAGGLMRVTFSFFAGVWLYQMRDRWSLPALPAWAAFAILFAALAMPTPAGMRPYWDLFAILFIFPPLVALSADTPIGGRAMQACAFVGLASYGVYILHVPLFSWVRLALQYVGVYDAIPGVAMVAIVAAVAVAAAGVLHVIYDVPVRRWLMGKARRGSREKAGPAPAS